MRIDDENNWRDAELGYLCSLIVDSEHKTAPKDPSGAHPLVRTTDLGAGRVDFAGAHKVNGDTYQRWTRRARPQAGDLILAREAPVGGICRVPTGAYPVLGQRTVLLRVEPRAADSRFLMYRLVAPDMQARMNAMAAGATVPHLNMADIRSFVVPSVPPLSTQRRVGIVLGAYDDLIEINTRRIEVLQDVARSLYREWFVRFRFPGHSNATFIEDPELGVVPQGWEVCKLGDVCSRITDGAHASPPTTGEGMPMASVKDMTHLSLDLQQCRLISPEDYARLRRQECKPHIGDVLVSKDGAKYLDKVVEVLAENQVVLLSSIAILRPSHAILPSVLTSMLKNADTKARLKGSVSGAAIPRVVLKDFARFKIVLPPLDLQDRFDRAGGSLLRMAARLESFNRILVSTRDLLLSRVITCSLDVSDLDLGPLASAEVP